MESRRKRDCDLNVPVLGGPDGGQPPPHHLLLGPIHAHGGSHRLVDEYALLFGVQLFDVLRPHFGDGSRERLQQLEESPGPTRARTRMHRTIG